MELVWKTIMGSKHRPMMNNATTSHRLYMYFHLATKATSQAPERMLFRASLISQVNLKSQKISSPLDLPMYQETWLLKVLVARLTMGGLNLKSLPTETQDHHMQPQL